MLLARQEPGLISLPKITAHPVKQGYTCAFLKRRRKRDFIPAETGNLARARANEKSNQLHTWL